MPAEAFAVHGLSDAFLADKPRFAEIVERSSGLSRRRAAGHPQRRLRHRLSQRRADAASAGRRSRSRVHRHASSSRAASFPAAPASLDALCRRFQIDLSDRTLHGALKDAELLARVYLELLRWPRAGAVVWLGPTRRLRRHRCRAARGRRNYRSADGREAAAHAAFRQPPFRDALWRAGQPYGAAGGAAAHRLKRGRTPVQASIVPACGRPAWSSSCMCCS